MMDGEPHHAIGLLLYLTLTSAVAIGFNSLLPPWQCQTFTEDQPSEELQAKKFEEPLSKAETFCVKPKVLQAIESRSCVETSVSVRLGTDHALENDEDKALDEPPASTASNPELNTPIANHHEPTFLDVACQHSETQQTVVGIGLHLANAISSSLDRTADIVSAFDDQVIPKLEKVNEKIANILRLEKKLDSHTAKLTGAINSAVCPALQRVKNVVSNFSTASPVKQITPKNTFCCNVQDSAPNFDDDKKSKGETLNQRLLQRSQSTTYHYCKKQKSTGTKRYNEIQTTHQQLVNDALVDRNLPYFDHLNSAARNSGNITLPDDSGYLSLGTGVTELPQQLGSSCDYPGSDNSSSNDDPRIPFHYAGSNTTVFHGSQESEAKKSPMHPDDNLVNLENYVLKERESLFTDTKEVLKGIPMQLVRSCSFEIFCEIIFKIFEAWSDTQLQFDRHVSSIKSNTVSNIDFSLCEGSQYLVSQTSDNSESLPNIDFLRTREEKLSDCEPYAVEKTGQSEKVTVVQEIIRAIIHKSLQGSENATSVGEKYDVEDRLLNGPEKESLISNLRQNPCSSVVTNRANLTLKLARDESDDWIHSDASVTTIEHPTVRFIRSTDFDSWRKWDTSTKDVFHECNVFKSPPQDMVSYPGSSQTSSESNNVDKQFQLTSRRVQSEGRNRNGPIDRKDTRRPLITDSSMISMTSILSVHSMRPANSYSLNGDGTAIEANGSNFANSEEWSGSISLFLSGEESNFDWISLNSSSSRLLGAPRKKKLITQFDNKMKKNKPKTRKSY